MRANVFKVASLASAVVLSFFSWRVLFNPGFFSMHDIQQVARLYELDKAIKSGTLLVRWVDGLGFNFGYPLFNFYPPLAYYVGELIHAFGLSYIDATKGIWLVAIVGSAITMYFFAKEFFGKTAAIVSSLFYVYAPYHAVDAYVRGALAELFSFVWLPLALLFSSKAAITGKMRWSVASGLVLALLMLTHNLIFLPFAGFFVAWGIMLAIIYRDKVSFRRSVSFLVVSLGVGFSLSAYFWLPAIFEKKFTLVDSLLTTNLAAYKIHFVCPSQLWDSPWGFAGSGVGCVDGVSFKVGKIHLLGSLVAAILSGLLFLKKKGKVRGVIFGSAILLALALMMTTDFSKIIWDNVSLLWYLQFPWRFLEFAALFSSFLVGSLVFQVRKAFVKISLAVILICLVIFYNQKYFSPQFLYPGVTDSDLTSLEEISWHVSSTSFEFMPKGVATHPGKLGNAEFSITKEEIPHVPYEVISGEPTNIVTSFNPGKFSLVGTFPTETAIQFNIVDFSGWQIHIDNIPARIESQNLYRLMTIKVPAGTHSISGFFGDTPIRVAGNIISLLSLVGVLGSFKFLWNTKK